MGNVVMKPIGDNEKYILLSEVADKCSSLAEKWNCIRDKNKADNSLEDELINRALQQQLYLYCFMPISRILGKRWCFIWSDYLKGFLSPQATINCNLLLVNSKDRIYFDLLVNSHPRLMDVSRADLYLNLDELKRLEENDHDFAGLAMVDSGLTAGEVKSEPPPSGKESNSTIQSDTGREVYSIRITSDPVDILPSKNNSESVSIPTCNMPTIATADTKIQPSKQIVNKSNSAAQAEKPKKIMQPIKKDEHSVLIDLEVPVEMPMPDEDDKEFTSKETDSSDEEYLQVEEFLSYKKKGIKGILPYGRTTWYNGVRSGRFPEGIELSEKCVVWKKSAILQILKDAEKKGRKKASNQPQCR